MGIWDSFLSPCKLSFNPPDCELSFHLVGSRSFSSCFIIPVVRRSAGQALQWQISLSHILKL